jgi:hypothetical protein
MSTLEIVVALLRGAHVAALVSLFGTLVLLTLVVPSAMAEARHRCTALAAAVAARCALQHGICADHRYLLAAVKNRA